MPTPPLFHPTFGSRPARIVSMTRDAVSCHDRERSVGDPTFIGTTEWIDGPAGLARIEFGFQDDLVALRSLNDAVAFVNLALETCA